MKATFSNVLKMNYTPVSNSFSLEKSQKTSVWILYGSIISWDILYTLKLVLECWCERVRLPLRSIWMTEDNDCIAGARRQVDHCRVLRQPNPWITVSSIQHHFQQEGFMESMIRYENIDNLRERMGYDYKRERMLGASRRACFTLFVRHVLTRCFLFNFLLRQRSPSLCFLDGSLHKSALKSLLGLINILNSHVSCLPTSPARRCI